MDVLRGPYFVYCKNVLSAFGLWPYQDPKTKFFLRTFMLTSCLTAFIPHLAKAYELRHDFESFLHCVISCLFYIEYMIKFFSMIFENAKCKMILEWIRSDFKTSQGKNLEIFHRYARESCKINKVYGYYFITVCVLYNMTAFVPLTLDLLVPLENETRLRVAPRLMKYNVRRLENNFMVICVHGFVFDMIGVSLVLGFDALLLLSIQHACALFQIVHSELKTTLRSLKPAIRCGSASKAKNESVHRKIVEIIIMHQNAINFADLIESTYSLANLLVIGCTLFDITLLEFLTVRNKKDFETAFRFAIFTSAELLHILFHNLFAQRIKDHSMMIHFSCYDTEWYDKDIPKECKKMLNMMMIRSQRPCRLTCNGFSELGLETYATILKASLSYFTFLSSV